MNVSRNIAAGVWLGAIKKTHLIQRFSVIAVEVIVCLGAFELRVDIVDDRVWYTASLNMYPFMIDSLVRSRRL